ncbi:hypothetical protein BU16DRAFT_543844 [Lophium mytilinum]|uniref:THO complex subunit 2 n=1 Tax=Lophium mytilinum TaxID=390894 RepID=A0A6A6QDN6_9PEZI|nr:hypothetical protein BU16DRAFT_543844 [Lophium mytilinum]
MAPNGKRKRGDRTYSHDTNEGSNRASPHRPQDLELGQQRNQQSNARGGRRGSRGGRGGSNTPRSPSLNATKQTSPLTSQAMSPPAAPAIPAPKPAASVASPVQLPAPIELPSLPSPVSQIPYFYQYLSEGRLSSWKDVGRQAVIDAATQAQSGQDGVALSCLFQELVRAAMDGKLGPAEAGAVVQEVLASSPDSAATDSASLFLDCVSILTEADASNPNLVPLLSSTGIDPARMRAELEVPLLIADNLVRATFAKMAIRKGTNALYKQSAYNLLREESEGYSKLMTEYFTTVNSAPPSDIVVKDTFQRVKALIGAFDLDVGRVLDITLDVFANLLVKHNEFFIKLLRTSSWWPEKVVVEGVEWEDQGFSSLPSWALPGCPKWHFTEEEKESLSKLREVRDANFWERVRDPAVGLSAYFELGSRRVISDTSVFKLNGAGDPMDITEVAADAKKKGEPSDSEKIQKWTQEWIAATHTLPPAGNRIAAQLLGFKLRFYASDTRDASDILPDNLIYLAALLIKIGFISLADLYPHLYPLDEDMPALKAKLDKEKTEKERNARGGGASNALANAGALVDDTKDSRSREAERLAALRVEANNNKGSQSKADEEEKEKLPEPIDQKTHLLRSLLCIGAIPEALFILGRFPWLLDMYSDLPPYIFRLLNHSLSKVYQDVRPIPDEDHLQAPKKSPIDRSAKGEGRATDFPPRRTMRWPKLDQKDNRDGVDYRFYWDEWADNVPVCQTVDDVFALCNTLVNLVGFKFGEDPVLLTKLARIGKKDLLDDPSEKNTKRWIDLSTRLLAPSLSFTSRNPGVVNEVWDLIKTFPTQTRYTIYAEWFTGATSRTPQMSTNFNAVRLETKHVLKRISKTNVKPMARLLAKAAYASPGVVFQVALSQIEAYENLTDVVIECGRYFTYLAYDVLTWALINSLGGIDRDRVQADGMLTSAWLRSLATFAGRVFKRYTVMSPTPVLQYVGSRLLRGSSHDLEVLEQIIVSMAGIHSDVTLSDTQMQGMFAGEYLRLHTLEIHLGDKRHELKAPSKRLLRSLTDTGLAAQLLIAIAQERQTYLFRSGSNAAPLKVLGANFDRIHQIFAQYLEFLRSGLMIKDFNTIIPSVIALISEFGLDPCIAFAISRNSIADAVEEAAALLRVEEAGSLKRVKEAKDVAQSPSNGDVEMGEALETPVTNGDHPIDMEPKTPASTDVPSSTSDSPITSGTNSDGPWNPVLKDLMDRLRPLLPAGIEERFSISFYVTFWQLSLQDLKVSVEEYHRAHKYWGDRMPTNDRRDVSAVAAKKRESDRKWIVEEQLKITDEMKGQIQRKGFTNKRLTSEKEHWFDGFPMMDAKSDQLHLSILQECFLPRLLLSPEDAHFVFAMLNHLHKEAVPGFRTMKLLDQLFREKQMTALIFQCTAREAENLGRFLNEVLTQLKGWHAKESDYDQYALGIKTPQSGVKSRQRDAEPQQPGVDFRRIMFKWHSAFYKALDACLNSSEYMHIRNAINILKAVNKCFPVVDVMGKGLKQAVESLAASEERGDLKLSASSLLVDFKKAKWVISQLFYTVSVDQAHSKLKSAHHNTRQSKSDLRPPQNTSRSNSEKPGTPQPSTNNPGPLNAAAPPFAPRSTPVNGVSKPGLTGKEVEDGEVEDEKRQALANASTATQSNELGTSKSTAPPVQEKVHNPTSRESDQSQVAPQSSETKATELTPQAQSGTIPTRPDSRGGPNRPLHALPVRPDTQTPVRGVGRVADRPVDRPVDRPADYHNHGRHDGRGGSSADYGRLDRPGEPYQEPFRGRHDGSPARGPRGRTPERGAPLDRDRRDPAWPQRDSREYPDDRSMRPPPRDIRPSGGRGPNWGDSPRDTREPRDSREPRDVRDPRDRMPIPPMDSRGPPAPADSRIRMHSGPPLPPAGASPYHGSGRDAPLNTDRPGYMPSKPPLDRARNQPFDRPPPPSDRGSINAERAPFIEDRTRPESFNSDRDVRRDRGSRPHSPRRDDRGPPSYPPRGDPPRDHRDDRGPPERLPPSFPPNRDRREDANNDAPTGPRGPRTDFSQPPPRGGPEMFQPTRGLRPSGESDHGRLNKDFSLPPRPNQQEESTFGRLNAPTDNIPSGPRGRATGGRGGRNFTAPAGHGFARGADSPIVPSSPAADRPPPGPLSERRDRRESAAMDTMNQSGPPTPSTDKPQDMSGIHPSRQTAFQAPQLQTNIPPSSMSGAPSGPRGSQRTPITSTGPSPTSRNPPTGPASSNERSSGLENKNQFAATFRRHLQPSNPPAQPPDNNESFERNDRGASIRGRASRPGGPMNSNNNSGHHTSSPGGSQPSTPNPQGPSRLDRTDYPAPSRGENAIQDDGRSDSRTHREGRRIERTRHPSRSGSAKNTDRRGEEKPRGEEEGKERTERPSGREKRGGSDRESGRRERTERSEREGGERREGRERRERGRDEGGRRESGAASSRGDEGGLRRGGPPMVEGETPSWNDQRPDGRNGDGRMRGSGDRDRGNGRERRDGGREERDARKRRGGDELVHGDNKRARRSNA